MNLPLFIAKRYFLSRKKKTFINVISVISMSVVGISTMALVIVLSVFNGLEGLLRNLYGSFDANITVVPAEGKSFVLTDDLLQKLESIDGITSIVDVIEDNALIKYKTNQRVVRLKGVGDKFMEQNRFSDGIVLGDAVLKQDSIIYAVIGHGIQRDLSLQLMDDMQPMVVYYPRDIQPGQLNPERMFRQEPIIARASFSVETSFDNNYVFVPIEFAIQLLNYGNRRTALEIQSAMTDLKPLKTKIQAALGPDFQVKLNEELRGSLYRILKWEKVFVFLTFGIIIAIGSVNIYFSLSMLVIDKKHDFAVFKALGASGKFLARIILANGAIIALFGAFTGLILGLLIVLLQQQFGFVSMGVTGAISEAYPVKLIWTDVFITALLVMLVTIVTSIQPARKAAQSLDISELQ